MTDAAVLDFVRDHDLVAGAEEEIRRRFGSPVRFYQRLARVLEGPEALAAEPQLVYRLRAIRDRRSGARASRSYRTTYGAESSESLPSRSASRPWSSVVK